MIDNAHAYARQLGERCPQTEVQWKLYEGEDHGSVMWPAALGDGDVVGGTLIRLAAT